MSRPARQANLPLAASVATYMDNHKLSARKLARTLGVNVTTLTRSLNIKQFSDGLSAKLIKEINGNFEDPLIALHKALHDLAEVDRLRSEVETTVRVALQRLEAAR